MQWNQFPLFTHALAIRCWCASCTARTPWRPRNSVMMGEFQQFNINDQDHCNGWPHKCSSFQGSFQQVDDVCYAVCRMRYWRNLLRCAYDADAFYYVSVRISFCFFSVEILRQRLNYMSKRGIFECGVPCAFHWIVHFFPCAVAVHNWTVYLHLLLSGALQSTQNKMHVDHMAHGQKYSTDVVSLWVLWELENAECHLNGNETNVDILKFKLRNDFYFRFFSFSLFQHKTLTNGQQKKD